MFDFEVADENTLGTKGQVINTTRVKYRCIGCNKKCTTLYYAIKNKRKTELKCSSCAMKKEKTEAHKEKFRLAANNKGSNNPFYGKRHTEDTKKQISVSSKGKHKGPKNGMYGKKHTEETLRKMSASHLKTKRNKLKKDI